MNNEFSGSRTKFGDLKKKKFSLKVTSLIFLIKLEYYKVKRKHAIIENYFPPCL